ncbi:MAG: bifunctional riboflavin kinase/FAD synthetase [Hyphomicrobiales bacterium]
MILLEGAAPLPAGLEGSAVAIGNFDGVHRGHQALLAAAANWATPRGKPWGVVTFEPHPSSFFRPDEAVFRLSPLPLKARLIQALGASLTACLSFDQALAGLDAEAFVERELVSRLKVGAVVVGYDFHFGKGRKGNAELLKRMGQAHGFETIVVDQVKDEAGRAPFSSSATRASLRHGHVEAAAHELGYWWTVLGTVVPGDRRGRTIGFPTANIVLEPGCEPKEGIYAVRVRLADDPAPRAAKGGAAYIGWRPTFATDRRFLEVFVFDFSGDLYGRRLLVEFVGFIRPDRGFDGVESLVRQMTQDCDEARGRLAALERHDPCAALPLGRAQAEGRI